MKLTILSRLILSYSAFFILLAVMCLYSILEMDRFSGIARSLLVVDTGAAAQADKIRDNLLSQSRYDKKFMITRDRRFHEQFILFQKEGDRSLQELTRLASGTPSEDFVLSVHRHVLRYRQLFEQEMRLPAGGTDDRGEWYAREKDKAIEEAIDTLEKMKAHSERDIHTKIGMLYTRSENARRVSLVMLIAFSIVGFIASLLLSRSINRPIGVLKKKTREIARGNFAGDVNLTSPPELAELAASLNFMCGKLADLDRMKEDFFSAVSHELRTPLASVKEGISLLRERPGDANTERGRRILAITAEECERLIGMVNTILDLSKMEAGMMTYHFAPGNLAVLVEKAVWEVIPLMESKGIVLEQEIEASLPPVAVDAERMLQVLRNLIGNAVKFTPLGGMVKIMARMVPSGLEVAVTDTGPGIPEESLVTVFDKYRQAGGNGAHHLKGTGLGLAIARQIVTAHGGRIWVENEPDHGSRFAFVLPA